MAGESTTEEQAVSLVSKTYMNAIKKARDLITEYCPKGRSPDRKTEQELNESDKWDCYIAHTAIGIELTMLTELSNDLPSDSKYDKERKVLEVNIERTKKKYDACGVCFEDHKDKKSEK